METAHYIHAYHPYNGSVKLETGSSRGESAESHKVIGTEHQKEISSYHKKNPLVWSAGADGVVRQWRSKDMALLASIPLNSPVSNIAGCRPR